VLARVKLIAEPWDIGPGGYQLGNYPHPFSEWNDRFRDGIRRLWRGDAGVVPDLARRLLGSAELFDKAGRTACASVNFVTAHDGFTLEDLVSFTVKRNFANGEDNRDGHDDNHSSRDPRRAGPAQAQPAGDAHAVAGRAHAAGGGRDRQQPAGQ
jgi:glycogen operon protein